MLKPGGMFVLTDSLQLGDRPKLVRTRLPPPPPRVEVLCRSWVSVGDIPPAGSAC